MIKHDTITLQTLDGRASYHDLRDDLMDIALNSGLTDGVMTLTTPHTTCSFFYEETMHDVNFFGDDLLHVDINEVMEKIAPIMTTEGQYHSPGPKHIAFGMSLSDPNYPAEKWVMLNTDAHLKASIYGTNSQSLILKNGELQIGSLGRIYFVDWDHLRKRERTINITTMGESFP